MNISRRTGSAACARAVALAAVGAFVFAFAACGSDNPLGDLGTTGAITAGGPQVAGGATTAGAGALSGELNGAGATSQESAMGAWRAGFQAANPRVTVNYDPVGSGGGRTQFLSGGVAFAGSDVALDDDEVTRSRRVCGPDGAIDLPVYVSPIAVVFNLSGITELNLAPATIAGIFSGAITTWNHPAIAGDNPGVSLPATAITAVHRSDESGTTQNFTDYLHATAPDAWPHTPSGAWPTSGGESAQGTSGVVQGVQRAQGAITYADASKVGTLGQAKVKVHGQWVAHSPASAAAAVDSSPRVPGRGHHDVAVRLDRTAAGVYPLVQVSYAIVCQRYSNAGTAELVKGFLTYVASAEGQAAAASAVGSAPISHALRRDVQAAIEAIGGGAST